MGKSREYEKAMQLAESGEHGQALEQVQAYLESHPDDGEALNDAGTLLYCMGEYEAAISHLKRAREEGASGEVLWNLVEVYLASGRPEGARELLDELEEKKLLSPDLLNRAANAFLNTNDTGEAIRMLRRSLEIAPEQEVLKPMIEVLESMQG